jgi:hypothetical protein
MAVLSGTERELDVAVLDHEVAIRRRNEDAAVLKLVHVRGRLALQATCPRQDRCERAGTAGSEMQDDADGSLKVARKVCYHASQGLDATGGGAYDDKIAARTMLIGHCDSPYPTAYASSGRCTIASPRRPANARRSWFATCLDVPRPRLPDRD